MEWAHFKAFARFRVGQVWSRIRPFPDTPTPDVEDVFVPYCPSTTPPSLRALPSNEDSRYVRYVRHSNLPLPCRYKKLTTVHQDARNFLLFSSSQTPVNGSPHGTAWKEEKV